MKKTIKMILVDDEMLMMDGMAAMLADLDDIEIVARVIDARIALDVARRMAPDIILVDVLMHTGNGVSLTSRLRQMSPGLRILGCSTSTAPQLIEDMLRAGARGYMTKNEPEGILEAAVRAVIAARGIYLSPKTIEALNDPTLKIDRLSGREREILAQLCLDVIPKQVADSLNISVKTVYNHIERIRLKAGVNNMIQLYPLAVKEGLLEMPG